MLMASDVAKFFIDTIGIFGDLPCVLEHHSREMDGILLDPLMSTPVMTIYKEGSSKKDRCILFTEKTVERD